MPLISANSSATTVDLEQRADDPRHARGAARGRRRGRTWRTAAASPARRGRPGPWSARSDIGREVAADGGLEAQRRVDRQEHTQRVDGHQRQDAARGAASPSAAGSSAAAAASRARRGGGTGSRPRGSRARGAPLGRVSLAMKPRPRSNGQACPKSRKSVRDGPSFPDQRPAPRGPRCRPARSCVEALAQLDPAPSRAPRALPMSGWRTWGSSSGAPGRRSRPRTGDSCTVSASSAA